MATWKVGDATVKSGGEVTGEGVNAAALRLALESEGATYVIADPPGGLPVDPDNDWTLDQYLRQHATFEGLDVETDYVAADEDIPPEVAEMLADETPRNPDFIY